LKLGIPLLLIAFSITSFAADKYATLPRLSVPGDFPRQYQKAARTVASAVVKMGLNPDEYFADVDTAHGDGLFHFDLWHESALKQRNDPTVLGDPTGKCRTVLYDPDHDRVTKIYGWK
jgi:hypothetical protein